MPQDSILDLSFDDLVVYLKNIDEKTFRARQIFDWIYQKSVPDFDRMKNLSAGLRRHLKEHFVFPKMDFCRKVEDDAGTQKFLFELNDGHKVETVLIPAVKRLTICVSTQVGCKFGCTFCASGIGGWKRDLTCGEILMQILQAQAQAGRKITHVVFMGMGEPLDNWPAVKDAIIAINDKQGMNVAARRVTVSTCGIAPQIRKIAELKRQIELAVSLHGYTDAVREELMPVNKKYPLKDLISACRDYVKQMNRQITFEYVLIDGLTCSQEAPKALAKLLKGLECKLNLIPYNAVKEFSWEAPSRNAIYRFRDSLIEHKLHATIRWSKGLGAEGACGQLRRK